ncbi:MAG TPA: hypothetical protein VFL41_11890 [Gaiellaceae bacterium]|nr:hypothetical protein [Gaiellaceae bacterium]
MDADSVLAPTFLAEAMRRLGDGIGGVLTGFDGGSFYTVSTEARRLTTNVLDPGPAWPIGRPA